MRNQLIIFLLAILYITNVRAQSYAGKLEQETVRTFELDESKEHITINAEKANITINSWNKNSIQIRLRKTCHNTDEKVCLTEIEFMKFNITKGKNGIELKNFIALDQNVKVVNSHLQFTYELMVPQNIDIDITNYFGNVDLSNLNGEIKCKMKYGNLNLENIEGTLFMDINFGKVQAKTVNVIGNIHANKCQIYLDQMSGSYSATLKYGSLEMIGLSKLNHLDISSKSSEIILRPDCNPIDFDISNEFGEILLSTVNCESQKNLEVLNMEGSTKKIISKENSGRAIEISSIYGDVSIIYN